MIHSFNNVIENVTYPLSGQVNFVLLQGLSSKLNIAPECSAVCMGNKIAYAPPQKGTFGVFNPSQNILSPTLYPQEQ